MKTPGQKAYEEELSYCPNYHDGAPRKQWNELKDYHNGRKFSDVILDAHLHCKKTGRLDLATRLDDLRNYLLAMKE